MAKKKRLTESLDEEELAFVTCKMNPEKEDFKTTSTKLLNFKLKLKCKNQRQKELHNLIKEKQIVFCQGSAGTGKSYIAAETALDLLKNGPYRRIIICCPNVESSSMPLGLLPGTVDEKMQPYMDAIEFTITKILEESGNFNSKDILNNLLKNELVVEEAAAFLRGKTFDDSIIIVDESENFNKQEMLLILTRIGRNSKMVFLGDNQQLDRRDIKKSGDKCGLDYAFDTLKEIEDIGFLEFREEDIVRNPIISEILKRWNNIIE
jgi:phosphate starvation-inducible PhoH-like protein